MSLFTTNILQCPLLNSEMQFIDNIAYLYTEL